MAKIAGIDLGTTFSAIAVLNELGQPQIVPTKDGERILPSAVFFDPENQQRALVGTEAKNSRGSNPDRVFTQFKRAMDTPDDLYPSSADRAPNTIETHNDQKITPVYLSSLVLKKLADDASHHEGETIRDVVISVPAYFKETQRNATRRAGEMAGLNVLSLVNEPTAAALHYSSQGNLNGKFMIFDLGGGTFDVTLLSIEGKEVHIITSGGNPKLGGCDFDLCLLKSFEDRYAAEQEGDLYDEGFTREDLERLCEDTKKRLSKTEKQKEYIRGSSGRVEANIHRDEFSNLIDPFLSQMELTMESILHEAGLGPGDIDQTLLVGGSTRIPAVSALVGRVMGKTPVTAPNVDETVALGAAIRAGLEMKDADPSKLTPAAQRELGSYDVIDVANSSYGTLVLSDNELKNDILIPKNSPLPFQVSKTYFTVSDNQTAVECSVTQGEGTHPRDVDMIHEGSLKLPPGRERGQPIEVTFAYDVSQEMHCSFKDSQTGNVHEVDLHPKSDSSTSDDLFDDLLID